MAPTRPPHRKRAASVDAARRRWLQAMAAMPVALGTSGTPLPARASVKTNAHIVIVGSGLGGIALANRLTRMLDGAKITIVDRKEEHNYQPGYTLVATGVWPVDKVRNRNADFHPAGVDWIREMAAGFDPAANTVITAGGRRIRYDFLVVATGLHLDFAQVEGMDVAAIGREGLGSVYPGPEAAMATWTAMQAFTGKGGNAVMTLPATPLKCAGAPLKMTFMLRDRLLKAGTLDRSKVSFQSALGNVFGVKVVNDNVLERWKALGIDVEFTQQARRGRHRRATCDLRVARRREDGNALRLHSRGAADARARRGEEQRPGLEGGPVRGRRLAGGGQGARCSTAAIRTCSASATSTARRAARRPRR